MIDLNNVQSVNLSQFFDSVQFRSRLGLGYCLAIDFCIVMFYMLMILMKFSFAPQTFFRIFFFLGTGFYYEIHWRKLRILYMLKIFTKFGVAPRSFCENRSPVQDQDQDHDITLDSNTTPIFHT